MAETTMSLRDAQFLLQRSREYVTGKIQSGELRGGVIRSPYKVRVSHWVDRADVMALVKQQQGDG